MKKVSQSLMISLVLFSSLQASHTDLIRCRVCKGVAKYGGGSLALSSGVAGFALSLTGVLSPLGSPLMGVGYVVWEQSRVMTEKYLSGKRFYQGAEDYYHATRSTYYYFFENQVRSWGKNPTNVAHYLHHHTLRTCELGKIQYRLTHVR